MRRPRGYAPWRPQKKTQELLVSLLEIIDNLRGVWPLTVRQIFYRAVAGGLVDKAENEYAKLIDYLNRGRRAGMIEWNSIHDGGAQSTYPDVYRDLEQVQNTLLAEVDIFQYDRQRGQETKIFVWCEAAGMLPMLYNAFGDKYSVPVLAGGGFDSVSVKRKFAASLPRHATILHVGDYDDSGVWIERSLAEDVEAFCWRHGSTVEFSRLAVTPEQVDEFDLMTQPVGYTQRSFDGEFTVQLEAIDPPDLIKIIQDEIEDRLDLDLVESIIEQEEEDRELLRERVGDLDS